MAGRWADLLVRTFCDAPVGADSTSVFTKALDRWSATLSEYAEERERTCKPIQWFEEPGLERGAFATFVGVQLAPDQNTWSAVALGDSCLLHFRGKKLITAFPREPGDGFDSNPPLICSRATDLDAIRNHTLEKQGALKRGDAFLLVTDAVAAWFLEAESDGKGSWAMQFFFEAPKRRDFNGWVRDLRKEGSMRNDDVTVMRIDVEDS